jgi:uncharacterized protein (TIGR02466 family)
MVLSWEKKNNMPVEYWFPTPIYYNMIDNMEEVQKELLPLCEDIDFVKISGWDNNSASFSSGKFSDNFLEKYQPKLFLEQLKHNIHQYLLQINPNAPVDTYDLVIDESWVTRTQRNEFHPTHSHGIYFISGAYYVKTNEQDGNIYFKTPNKLMIHTPFFNKVSGWDTVLHSPKVGKILLFPAWLEHGVLSNQTDSDRITLSFNIMAKSNI